MKTKAKSITFVAKFIDNDYWIGKAAHSFNGRIKPSNY
jgi:hypothetical protein